MTKTELREKIFISMIGIEELALIEDYWAKRYPVDWSKANVIADFIWPEIESRDKIIEEIQKANITFERVFREELGLLRMAYESKITLLASCEKALESRDERLTKVVEALKPFAKYGEALLKNKVYQNRKTKLSITSYDHVDITLDDLRKVIDLLNSIEK